MDESKSRAFATQAKKLFVYFSDILNFDNSIFWKYIAENQSCFNSKTAHKAMLTKMQSSL